MGNTSVPLTLPSITFETMRRVLVVALFFGTPFIVCVASASSIATDDITRLKSKYVYENEPKDTFAIVDSVRVSALDLNESSDGKQTYGEWLSDISTKIIPFDNDEIPTDEDLFNCHINSKQFRVPMVYNSLVKEQIDYFGTRWQPILKQMLSKSAHFFPLYEEILVEYNMPVEIKYLSVIESALNPYARSRSGAVGAWQFMPATARIFDLNMNYQVDERRSLEKSTRAACVYLQQMYDQYGDWLLALASYNCGPGNVRKAMRRSGKTSFWDIYDHLPRETQKYVPKFIAMAYMMNFCNEFGITPAPIDDNLYQTERVFCEEGLDLAVIADKLEISKKRLLQCNPEMIISEIPYDGKGYNLYVPCGKASLFYENQWDIQKISAVMAIEKRIAEANKPKINYHYVRRGESLTYIARKHGVTVSQLRAWNRIRGSTIYPKQRLKVHRS